MSGLGITELAADEHELLEQLSADSPPPQYKGLGGMCNQPAADDILATVKPRVIAVPRPRRFATIGATCMACLAAVVGLTASSDDAFAVLAPVVRITPSSRVKHAHDRVAVVVSGFGDQAAVAKAELQRLGLDATVSGKAGSRRVGVGRDRAGRRIVLVPGESVSLSQYISARRNGIKFARPAKNLDSAHDIATWKVKSGQIVQLSVGGLASSTVEDEISVLVAAIERSGMSVVSVPELFSAEPATTASRGDAQSATAPQVTAQIAARNGMPDQLAVLSRSPASSIAMPIGTISSTTKTIGATRVAGID
jgi:hypothetical protein